MTATSRLPRSPETGARREGELVGPASVIALPIGDELPLFPDFHGLRVEPMNLEDDVVDLDVILLWGSEKRMITGADLLGRLLRGIATRGPERTVAAAPGNA